VKQVERRISRGRGNPSIAEPPQDDGQAGDLLGRGYCLREIGIGCLDKDFGYAGPIDARWRGRVRGRIGCAPLIVRKAHGRLDVNGVELVGLVLSLGLIVYLFVALLKPEWFA
jgi:K+-transporting ATPase KdpF subunit